MSENQFTEEDKQLQEKIARTKKRVEEVLREEGMALVARLHITDVGINAMNTLVPVEEKSKVEVYKSPIIIPK